MAMECLDHVLDFLEACGKATAVGTLGFFEGSFEVLPVSIEPEHYPVQHLLIACCILLLPDLFRSIWIGKFLFLVLILLLLKA